ncbi:methyltransferase [Mycolicibacterium phlei]|uniref:class I SAM-dependent methyltransferase n=1 Tax=Mycobacteroides chelonae TaxID=1774 RepID=UPI000618BF1D|nr:class I SAM-dependent methyltransferase [Mycobacteroides chelonae]VEG19252.1 methyltransferase [Mycolicibacterium phlei]AKC40025.1 methyltransferase [Mycobacteroides chelonae]ANA99606.1 methyltransferase [Mycobacteroides chelonae CCUG 47445]OLT82571.1 methyltransferase [Mycobacteroides chelonae]ORV16137.1 methyltransferase [Mycobacteroides chelonae]
MTTPTALDRLGELVWSDALDAGAHSSAGYLDLLPPPSDQPQRVAQRAMNNPVVAAVYQGPWRWGQTVLYTGITPSAERRRAARALRLDAAHTLLDVACGPGNFTKYLGSQLSADGLAVGLDFSEPMLRRAVRTNIANGVGYLRADARTLPFDDGSFDAVCCFAALYLVPEPFKVLDEMLRVLRPGGRIAVMTSCTRGPRLVRSLSVKMAARNGLHGFDRDDITSVLWNSGFHDIEQEVRGLSQFVSATKG